MELRGIAFCLQSQGSSSSSIESSTTLLLFRRCARASLRRLGKQGEIPTEREAYFPSDSPRSNDADRPFECKSVMADRQRGGEQRGDKVARG